jgi:hypothetical protein
LVGCGVIPVDIHFWHLLWWKGFDYVKNTLTIVTWYSAANEINELQMRYRRFEKKKSLNKFFDSYRYEFKTNKLNDDLKLRMIKNKWFALNVSLSESTIRETGLIVPKIIISSWI